MTEPQAPLLVVDDDERIRGLLQKFLIRHGFLVTIARDALQARRLLAETRMPVGQIGESLGFASAAYFTRAFQHITGKSPSAFRRAP